MIFSKTILILEDNLKALSKLLDKLDDLEGRQPYDLSTIVLTNYIQVQKLINTKENLEDIDIILLDRDCKLGGSFHTLDIEKFGPDKIIAISSVPEFNEEAKRRGVKRIIQKEYSDLDKFVEKVIDEIEDILGKMPLTTYKS